VETKVLKQAVRRKIDRFPADFMFEMTKSEFENLRSQFATSNRILTILDSQSDDIIILAHS